MADPSLTERLWFAGGVGARAARLALAPLEGVYRGVVAARGALYDAGVIRARGTAIPAVSVGNLSVGGTGKTPVAAWLAGRLRERGARPAIVLRGYGEDEPLVHRVLNPGVPVIVAPDRVEGTVRARAAGADVAVLDDAFQHRRARRVADVVLLSADRWSGRPRLLPAGPWREPLGALRRATVAVVTRKAASPERAAEVEAAIASVVPGLPVCTVHLVPMALVSLDGEDRLSLGALDGVAVRVLVAVGDPDAFLRQLAAQGARVSAEVRPDHHHFSDDEIAAFARSVPRDGMAVCTLKDAVKLTGRWPAGAGPLWYVSQHVVVERGGSAIETVIDSTLRARPEQPTNAG